MQLHLKPQFKKTDSLKEAENQLAKSHKQVEKVEKMVKDLLNYQPTTKAEIRQKQKRLDTIYQVESDIKEDFKLCREQEIHLSVKNTNIINRDVSKYFNKHKDELFKVGEALTKKIRYYFNKSKECKQAVYIFKEELHKLALSEKQYGLMKKLGPDHEISKQLKGIISRQFHPDDRKDFINEILEYLVWFIAFEPVNDAIFGTDYKKSNKLYLLTKKTLKVFELAMLERVLKETKST